MKHFKAKNRPYACGSVLNRSEQLLFSVTPNHYIGLYNLFLPFADCIEQESEKYRVSNLKQINKSRQCAKTHNLVVNTF